MRAEEKDGERRKSATNERSRKVKPAGTEGRREEEMQKVQDER